MSDNNWLDCCQMPGPLHADECCVRFNARTIDGVMVRAGLRVIDYNFDKGEVVRVHHVDSTGEPWFEVRLDKGGFSSMDGLRLWTRVNTNSGWVVAAEREVFSD